MSETRIGFIGGGRITRIFLEGWRRAGRWPGSVSVAETDPEVLGRLRDRFAEIERTTDRAEEIVDAGLVIAALHPPALRAVLPSLVSRLRPDTVVLSLAPKINMAALQESLGGHERLARCIPNAPSIVARGFNPLAFSPALPSPERLRLRDLLAPFGECPEVPEETLEGWAILTGMGPTYLWFQLQALRDLGRSFGLEEGLLDAGLRAMTIGAADTLFASGLDAEEVQDLVPVRPLADKEESLRAVYREKLTALHARLHP